MDDQTQDVEQGDKQEDSVQGQASLATSEVIGEGAEAGAINQPFSDMNYAGFWARFFAMLLDSLILGAALAVVMIFTYDTLIEANNTLLFGQPFDAQRELANAVLMMIVTVVFWKFKEATPGKMMMGISVVDAKTGGPASTGQLVLRYFGYIVSMLPLFLGYIWVAFDDRKQGFHDKIAGTVVILNADKDEVETEQN